MGAPRGPFHTGTEPITGSLPWAPQGSTSHPITLGARTQHNSCGKDAGVQGAELWRSAFPQASLAGRTFSEGTRAAGVLLLGSPHGPPALLLGTPGEMQRFRAERQIRMTLPRHLPCWGARRRVVCALGAGGTARRASTSGRCAETRFSELRPGGPTPARLQPSVSVVLQCERAGASVRG